MPRQRNDAVDKTGEIAYADRGWREKMGDQPIAVDSPIPGVLVNVFDEAAPIRLRVRSVTELAGWLPLPTESLPNAKQPIPTTIEYRGVLYGIIRREQGPFGWQYDLVDWPQAEMVRRKITLSRETWQEAEEEKKIERRQQHLDWLVRPFVLVIPFLPAPIQERISETCDYDPPGWTKINSLVVGALSAVAAIIYQVYMPSAMEYGPTFGLPAGRIGWVIYFAAPYLMLDSFLRFGTAVAGGGALGLLPLEIVYWILRAVARLMGLVEKEPLAADTGWLDATKRLGPSKYTAAVPLSAPEVAPAQEAAVERGAELVALETAQLKEAEHLVAVDCQYPGVQVSVFDEDSPVRVRVRTEIEPVGWEVFEPDPTRRANREISTTVEYRGALYAIGSCVRHASGWQYDLVPWPVGEIVRRRATLTHTFWKDLDEQRRLDEIRRRRRPMVESLKFLIAFLPSTVQRRIGDSYGYNSDAWALFNSGVIAWMSVVATMYSSYSTVFDALAVRQVGQTSPWVLPIASSLALDSLIRFVVVMTGAGVLGFLPLELLYQGTRGFGRLAGIQKRKGKQ
jgi:hypothetical protein